MMMKNTIIPKNIQEKSSKYFSHIMLMKAKTVMETGRISISFNKTNEQRFIVSGIVNDGDQFQVKMNHRCLEDNKHRFTTGCNCRVWNDEDHCKHVAALYMHYQISEVMKDSIDESVSLKAHVNFHGQAVHVNNYGRLEAGAQRLVGANMNSTYSSVQYMLTTRKSVNWPITTNFVGKLIINFVQASTLEEYESIPGMDKKFYPLFSFKDTDGVEHTKISIFQSLYLFNWETGEAFDIPSNIKNTLKKIHSEGLSNDINYHMKTLAMIIEKDEIDVRIKDKSLAEADITEVNIRFSIEQAKRKGFLNFQIDFFDNSERLITPPAIFQTITSEGGFLNSFRTKNDSYDFLKILLESLTYNQSEYKKFVYSSTERVKLVEWIEYFQNYDELFFYDEINASFYTLKTKTFKLILMGIFECFSETAARFSFFHQETRELYYQLPKTHLFNGIADFYRRVQLLNMPIFYNNVEVKTWSSNIRFERKNSNLDWFEVNLVVDENDLEVIKNAELGEEYLVSNAGLVILDTKEKELLKFMKKYTKHEAEKTEIDANNMQKFSLNFKRSRIFELFELKKHGIEGALTHEEEQICENLLNMTEMPHYEPPEKVKGIIRDYQHIGYNWLRFLYDNRFGACLADDMGLGKTLQTIAFLDSILHTIERVLIVCPVSILLNWEKEVEKFSDFSDEMEIYYGEGRSLKANKKIILTSYGVMKKESYTTFEDMRFDILIMDEVQHLKNIRSQGATAARNLNANFRICLTGTPVENDLSEFYNIIDLSIPGIWGDLSLFRSSSSKKSRLLARQTVRPFILRRTKTEVLTELPEKIENHVYLNFTDPEREHYLNTLTQIRNKMNEVQKGRKYSEILKSLLQLRQLCLWQKKQHIMSTKIDFLMNNLQQLMEEGHKVLVFSQFTTYLDIIQNKVRENSWNFARIDGSQTMKKRQAEVERFQEGDAQIFLISLKAGGVGLNLTAASYIFLMDPWWNPAVENQAIDRAYRIGQENKLTVYRPIIKDSVEEKVLVLQNVKKELFKDLMNSDDSSYFSGKLSMNDFANLLS